MALGGQSRQSWRNECVGGWQVLPQRLAFGLSYVSGSAKAFMVSCHQHYPWTFWTWPFCVVGLQYPSLYIRFIDSHLHATSSLRGRVIAGQGERQVPQDPAGLCLVLCMLLAA